LVIQRLRGLIHTVSAERIRDEIARILTEGGARRGFELLEESGLLAEILPEVAAMKGVEQPPEFHPEGDVWTHTLIMLEGLEDPTLTLALGVLLHDVGKPPTFRVADRIRFDEHDQVGARMSREILERLRFSNETTERVEALVANHMKFKDVQKMRDSTLKRFLRQDHFDEHLDLHRIDCLSSHGYLDAYEFTRERLAATPEEELRPPRLITGDDLIAKGYCPGPMFSRMLSVIEDAQLEGRIRSREEAFALVQDVFGKPNPQAERSVE
jgi:poly(A) polymerase